MAASRPWSLTLFSYSESGRFAKSGLDDIKPGQSLVSGLGGKEEDGTFGLIMEAGVYIFRCQIPRAWECTIMKS